MKLNYITLMVRDIEKSMEFYQISGSSGDETTGFGDGKNSVYGKCQRRDDD